MTLDFQRILFTAVFVSQIVVLSFYVPQRSRRYYALMFTRYPPEEYPRLYPMPREKMERRLALAMPLHLVIGGISVITLVVSLLHGAHSLELARRMFTCFLFQILPTYLSMFLMIRVAKAFRAMPPPSVRSVELRPWRTADFVSPLWIGLGLAGQVIALTCAVVAYLHRREALLMALICSLMSGALLLRMLNVLLGRVTFMRSDPFMSTADTFRVRQRRFRALFRGGAGLGAAYAFLLLYQAQLFHLDFDLAYTFVGLSIVFQLVWLALASAQGRDLETRDFSVYRADSGTQDAP
jgi:hypothetical protein